MKIKKKLNKNKLGFKRGEFIVIKNRLFYEK
jgi:hypothetical protein